MKRVLIIAALSGVALAQQGTPVLVRGSGAPVGACAQLWIYEDTATNPVDSYFCPAGVWVKASGSSGSTAFSSVMSGTNISAAMVLGSGSSLSFSGTGTVNANQINGTAFAGTNGNLASFGAANIPADSGLASANVVLASSPGAGLAHFPGGSQTVTSSGVAIADLTATGTPSATTFLRGDNSWATPAGSGNVTAGGTLGNNAVVIGGGSQAVSTISVDSTASHALFATGSAPAFRAITGTDIPTLNQNTSGTAANLSGTPALPNGTTATTQSVADNTTKVATDAFVLANSVTNPLTTLGDALYGGAAGVLTRLAGPTATNGVPQVLTSIPSGGAAVAPVWLPGGVAINPQTGTTYTVLATDRASYLSFSNAGSIAITLPQSGGTGFANNFVFVACDIGAGTATITPTTSTISFTTGSAYTSAASSMALTTGQCAWIYSDNTNYVAILR